MTDLRNIKGRKSTTHGQSVVGNISSEYRAWFQMKSRCNNPKQTNYYTYDSNFTT